MTTERGEPVDVEEMLRTIDARVRSLDSVPQHSLGALAEAREQLGRFRQEPIGGRLKLLKRIVFWFTASAFDRQSKVQERVLDAMDDIARELVDVRNRIAVLRADLGVVRGSSNGAARTS